MKTNSRSATVAVIGCSLLQLLFVELAIGGEFRVEGRVVRQLFEERKFANLQKAPNSKVVANRYFLISVKDNEWKIRLRDLDGKWDLAYLELASDGHELFYLKRFNHNTFYTPVFTNTSIKFTNDHRTVNTGNATIEMGGVPTSKYDNDFFVLWLTFASGNWCKLKLEQSDSIFGNLVDTNTFRFSIDSMLVDDSVPIPFVTSASRTSLRMIKEYDLKGSPIKYAEWPSPYERGFVDLEYATTAWKEISTGSKVPSSINYMMYGLFYGDVTNKANVYRSETIQSLITVDRFWANESHSSFKPEIALPTAVEDFRFVSTPEVAPNLTYLISNSVWPERDSEFLQNYTKEHNVVNRPRARPAGSHKWIMLLILAALVVPIVPVVLMKTIKAKTPQ